MEAEVDFLRDQVHRLNSALRQYQLETHSWATPSQVKEARSSVSPEPLVLDRSVMAPLIAEYDRHMDQMSELLQMYQVQMTDVKLKLEGVIKENERLHAELRVSVEKQLDDVPAAPGVESGTMEEETVIRNLQEQVQLSEQERLKAMELWQTAAQQLDSLQQVYQKTISDAHSHNTKRQQLQDYVVHFQQNTNKLRVANQRLEVTNQSLLKTLTEQNKEMEGLHSKLRQAQADLRKATSKVDEMTKLLQNIQNQMQKQEEDVAEAHSREEAAEKRLQQLQATLIQLEARLKAASQEAEAVCREQTVWEKKVEELQACCTTLEDEKYEALAKVRENVQMAKEVALQKDQSLLREKQKTEEMEVTKESIKLLIQEAAVRTRKEVDNVRKQCNLQINRMAEELSALQLECADKESQIESSLRMRKAVEEELDKIYKEGSAEPDFKKLDSLHQRCIDAERMNEDMKLTVQNTQNKLKKTELDYMEELSRCQEKVQRLQGLLTTARDNCVLVSEERLKLQQENLELLKERDELRKATLIVQKKAKQKVSQIEQEYSLKEQVLEARMRVLEECSQSSSADMKRLLKAQQKSAEHWKEKAKTLVQALDTKVTDLKAELHRQKQHSYKLEAELETSRNTFEEYEKQMAENQEKVRCLQRRLTQTEQREPTAPRQLSVSAMHQRKTAE